MSKLHWLPVHSRIIFKLLLLVYKALNGKAPSYISSLLSHRKCSRSLRSSGQELLTVPLAKLKTYGDRAFGIAAPRQWNSLPLSIRKSLSIAIFKSVNFWTFGTSCFYSLERRFLALEYRKPHFPGLYCLTKKSWKNGHFWTKTIC